MSALLTYAKNEHGQLVHVDSVLKGSACKCTCPNCNKPLDAKNGGSIREHHFAHSHGNICEGAYETTLHLLAKEVLLSTGKLMLPISEDRDMPSGLVVLHDLKKEEWDTQYGFKPDVEGFMDNGERIMIEFFVSHKIPKKKRDVIIENNLKCVEIDLNYVELDNNKIQDFLVNDNDCRKWVTKLEEKKKGDGEGGIYYKRNEWQLKAIEELKKRFEENKLTIGFWYGDFNLQEKGYDVCEANSSIYRGFKSDLILFRSLKEDKGHIAISVRGRRRNEGHKTPKNLRVIDIIVRDNLSYDNFMNESVLRHDNMRVIFEGFNEKPKENTYGQYKTDETIEDDDSWQYHQPNRGYNDHSSDNRINSYNTWDDDWERFNKIFNNL